MKILLPYKEPEERTIDDPVVTGGIEFFCRLIHHHFDVEVYQIPYHADSTWDRKRKIEQSKNIILRANEIGADIIIINYHHAIYTGKEISNSNIPVMTIMHGVDFFPSILSRLHNLTEKNHSIFFVSKWQQNRYEEMAKRTNNKSPKISGYINSSYCKIKVPVLESEYDCVTVGRCNIRKKPFLLKEMLKDTNIQNLVITNHPFLNKEDRGKYEKQHYRYYQKGKSYNDVLWNLTHEDVLKNLSKCSSYFSTWNSETWGITALESLSCGVPLILNGYKDNTHASEIIPASKNHYKVIPTNDKDSLINSINFFRNVDKKEIQEMTWEKHNEKQWLKHFNNCIDKTIETYNKNNNNLLKYINAST